MSPLIMRFFTLVGIALAAASMQIKARAEPLDGPGPAQARPVIAGQPGAFSAADGEAACTAATPELRRPVGAAGRFLALGQRTADAGPEAAQPTETP